MKNKKGFGLIEILIVLGVIGIAFVALVAFLINSSGTIFRVTRNTEAVSLAEEAIEGVRSLRDESWTTNIATLVEGTTYYPVISGNKWTLTTTDPGVVNNLYTRIVVIEGVNRDVNDDIAVAGTDDPNTKQVTVTVNWSETQSSQNVTIDTYVTNFLDN
jgi:prepilin-type N-terminal cleavage/methylation domain-containing protein